MTTTFAPRLRGVQIALAVFVSLLMLGPVSAGLSSAGPSAVHTAMAAVVPPASSAGASSARPAPAGGAAAGTFFNNTQIPLPTSPTCYAGSGVTVGACANITNEPSINYTSTGVLAMAYTAMTNQSPCANVSAYAESEIGFVRSTNFGASWSTPTYLGNPQCSAGPAYASAWEPSLTSLANGTLALVYIEYNLSANSGSPYIYYPTYVPYSSEGNTPTSRLVFTESYDGGVSWTTPNVLNSSVFNATGSAFGWAPERPWISAVGATIYVTWENFTQSTLYPQSYYPNFQGGASIGSHLLVSKDGGASWGASIDLPVTTGFYYPYSESVDMNPTVLAAPNGSVYVAFTTNVSYAIPCLVICLQNPALTGNVVVGVSQNNGTTFSWATVDSTVALSFLWGQFYDPSPHLAVSPLNGQVYVTFSAALPGTYCFPGTAGECAVQADGTGVFFANSSDGGHRWSPAHLVDPSLVDVAGGPNDATYNPSVVVDAQGVVHVEMSYSQFEACAGYCILQKQLYYNSTDNGTTFGTGFTISGNYTYSPYEWDGEYDTMAVAGTHVWIAYVQDLCPAWATQSCNMYASSSGRAQVTVATPFHGAGFTLTFSETGLPIGSNWSVNVLGNEASGVAPASLSVTGAPTGQWLNWTIPWVNVSYGTAYAGTIPVGTSYVFGGATTIPVTFSELVRVEVQTLPTFNPCYSPQCLNWLLPSLGVSWVPLGTVSTVAVTSAPPACGPTVYCEFVNASFLGWVGAGNGSVTSNQTSITFTADGPVNETANFLPFAICEGIPVICTGGATFDVTFQETGLPSGVAWSVSADGITGTSTNSTVVLAVPNGTVAWNAWSVPNGRTNVWAPSSTSLSTIEVPYTSVVNLTYTNTATSSLSFPVEFNEAGLPAGSDWSANLSGTLYAFSQPNASALVSTSTYNLSYLPLYLENGTGYSVESVFVEPFVMNSTNSTFGSGGRLTVAGPVAVTAVYQSTVEVSVSAGPGGNATPAQSWVVPGSGVTLHETPDPGYTFVGWAGYGRGATTTGQSTTPSPTIFPSGPVTEVASFARIPATRYTATVNAVGLPSGQGFTVALGTRNLTSEGPTAQVTDLLAGWYAFNVSDVYANSTLGTRYVYTSATAQGGTLFSNGTLEVTGDLTLNLTFETRFLVELSSVGSGSLSVAPGVYWYAANATVLVTATPSSGQRFLGWTGTGTGAYTGSDANATIRVGGAIQDVATFAAPLGPVTYTLTVHQSGLPSGINWAFALGASGSSGSGTTLTLAGLSGPYVLNVPAVVGSVGGTRYTSNLTGNLSLTVGADRIVNVTFSEEALLSVSATSGGSVTPAGATWYAVRASVPLTATPSSGQMFVGWTGTGGTSYTGPNTTATVNLTGPVMEVATFAPTVTTTTTSAGPGDGLSITIAAFVVLLIAGLAVGLLLARRRPPTAEPAAAAEPPSEQLYGEPTVEPGDDGDGAAP